MGRLAFLMNRLGHQFLARPGLPDNQYIGMGRGDSFNLIEQRAHLRTVADDIGKVPAGRLQGLLCILGATGNGRIDHRFDFINLERFGNVIICPVFHGLHRILGRGKSGDHDKRQFRIYLFNGV